MRYRLVRCRNGALTEGKYHDDAKSDSANVSHQQSGFALNFAPNAMFSASGDDACCGTKPNK